VGLVIIGLSLLDPEPIQITYKEYDAMVQGAERERAMARSILIYAYHDEDVGKQCDEYNQPIALTQQQDMYFEVNCIDRGRYMVMVEGLRNVLP
jgi:hypothetical protein